MYRRARAASTIGKNNCAGYTTNKESRKMEYNETNETPPKETPELTEEMRAQGEAWLRAHPYGEQDENGIDISLLRENLKLTPTQRLERNTNALKFFMEVRRASKAAGLS